MRATKQQLIEAKALIQDKKNWTVRVFARDAKGFDVPPNSEDATCFCAMGALAKVMGKDYIDYRADEVVSLNAAALDMGYISAAKLNDHAGHEKVMLMFKKAIEETSE